MHDKMPKPLILGILASLTTGLITLLVLKKKSDQKNKRPRKAPQLHIENPGTQDDFPKAPTVSDIG